MPTGDGWKAMTAELITVLDEEQAINGGSGFSEFRQCERVQCLGDVSELVSGAGPDDCKDPAGYFYQDQCTVACSEGRGPGGTLECHGDGTWIVVNGPHSTGSICSQSYCTATSPPIQNGQLVEGAFCSNTSYKIISSVKISPGGMTEATSIRRSGGQLGPAAIKRSLPNRNTFVQLDNHGLNNGDYVTISGVLGWDAGSLAVINSRHLVAVAPGGLNNFSIAIDTSRVLDAYWEKADGTNGTGIYTEDARIVGPTTFLMDGHGFRSGDVVYVSGFTGWPAGLSPSVNGRHIVARPARNLNIFTIPVDSSSVPLDAQAGCDPINGCRATGETIITAAGHGVTTGETITILGIQDGEYEDNLQFGEDAALAAVENKTDKWTDLLNGEHQVTQVDGDRLVLEGIDSAVPDRGAVGIQNARIEGPHGTPCETVCDQTGSDPDTGAPYGYYFRNRNDEPQTFQCAPDAFGGSDWDQDEIICYPRPCGEATVDLVDMTLYPNCSGMEHNERCTVACLEGYHPQVTEVTINGETYPDDRDYFYCSLGQLLYIPICVDTNSTQTPADTDRKVRGIVTVALALDYTDASQTDANEELRQKWNGERGVFNAARMSIATYTGVDSTAVFEEATQVLDRNARRLSASRDWGRSLQDAPAVYRIAFLIYDPNIDDVVQRLDQLQTTQEARDVFNNDFVKNLKHQANIDLLQYPAARTSADFERPQVLALQSNATFDTDSLRYSQAFNEPSSDAAIFVGVAMGFVIVITLLIVSCLRWKKHYEKHAGETLKHKDDQHAPVYDTKRGSTQV